MASLSFTDFYIKYPGHPSFNNIELVEDDVIRVIVQKYEMIIFTNKGDLLGDPNFGADLPNLLYETKLSAEFIEGDIKAQIADYIPEVDNIEYELKVEFFEDPDRFQEYMVIGFKIRDIEIFASVL
jgi:hypothetical protein